MSKSTTICLRFPPELLVKVQEFAKAHGATVSTVIRWAVVEFLKKEGDSHGKHSDSKSE